MAKDLTELIRDKEPELLYHHSRRVYLFGALTGQRKGLAYDPELLYVGAMFHDIGLTEQYRHSTLRFEVDGANAARDFLRKYGVPESSVEMVWDAIALHTTPGIPEHKKAVVALRQRTPRNKLTLLCPVATSPEAPVSLRKRESRHDRQAVSRNLQGQGTRPDVEGPRTAPSGSVR
jgi:hypothetical protein